VSPPVGFPIWPAFQDRRGGAPASRVGERGHGEDAEPGALGDCHADCRGLVVVQCDGVQGGRADPVEDGLAKSRDVTARNHCQERREPAFVGATGCYDSRSGHEAPIDHFGEVGDMDVGGGLDLEAAGGQGVVERGGLGRRRCLVPHEEAAPAVEGLHDRQLLLQRHPTGPSVRQHRVRPPSVHRRRRPQSPPVNDLHHRSRPRVRRNLLDDPRRRDHVQSGHPGEPISQPPPAIVSAPTAPSQSLRR